MVELGPVLVEYVRAVLWSGISIALFMHIITPLPRIGMLNFPAIPSYISMYFFNAVLKLFLFIYIASFSFPLLVLFILVRIALLKYAGINLNLPMDLQFAMSFLFVLLWASYESRKLDQEFLVESRDGLEEYIRGLLKKHSVNISEDKIRRIKFLVSPSPYLYKNAITYGGLFARPRIVLPEGFRQSFSEVALVGILSHELGHILRRDIGFKSLVYTLDLMFIKFGEKLSVWISSLISLVSQFRMLIVFLPLLYLFYYGIKVMIYVYRWILHFLSSAESYVAEFLTDTVALSFVPSSYMMVAFHELNHSFTINLSSREQALNEGANIAKKYVGSSVTDGFFVQLLETFEQGLSHTHPPMKKRILWAGSIDHHIEIYHDELAKEIKRHNSFEFKKIYICLLSVLVIYLSGKEVVKLNKYLELKERVLNESEK